MERKERTGRKSAGLLILCLAGIVIIGTVSWLSAWTHVQSYDTKGIQITHTSYAPESALEVAEKAANWIISKAIPENGGYKWDHFGAQGGHFYQSNMQWGSAGIGTFFLRLYSTTGNSTYLDFAKGAAQWVITKAVPDSGGYKWAHPDDDIPDPGWWLSPTVSGIAEFLLMIHEETGNPTYLNYAEGAARWMIAMGAYESGGWFVPYNPPGIYGSQTAHGISPGREAYTMTFLLHLYEKTGNSTYRMYVEKTADWLILGPDIRTEQGGYKWRTNRPYSEAYSVLTNGMVARFFYEAYQALNNATYMQYANGAIQWILSQATTVDSDRVKWPSQQGASDYPLTIGDKLLSGTSVTGDILLLGYLMTNNATYLDYARDNANWIIAQGTPEGGGCKLVDAPTSAQVYGFLKELHLVANDPAYLTYADNILTWIIYNATATDSGYEWRALPYYPYFTTWFNGGASGVGYYLAIPEFSSSLALPLFMAVSSLITIVFGRKKCKLSERTNSCTCTQYRIDVLLPSTREIRGESA